jgi:hypothetical protein
MKASLERCSRTVARAWVASILAGLLLLTAEAPKAAQDALSREKAQVVLRVLGTWPAAATTPIGETRADLSDGEPYTTTIGTRTSGPPTCGSNVMFSFGSLRASDYLHVWEAHLELRQATLESIQIVVDWKRLVAGPDGATRVAGGDHREITLREGDRHLLDFVEASPCLKSVALELSASIGEDTDLAGRRIGYDMWLVSEKDGQRTTRRWQVSGKQGEKVDFDFGPVRTRLDGIHLTNGESDVFETTVNGHIRGRLRDDGLEVALMANRDTGPSDRHWMAGGYGEKVVRVASGETIQLDLPAPKEIPRPPVANTPEGQTHGDEILRSLARQRVSLILTARPME